MNCARQRLKHCIDRERGLFLMASFGRRCFRPALSCVLAVLVAACSVACMQINIAFPPPSARLFCRLCDITLHYQCDFAIPEFCDIVVSAQGLHLSSHRDPCSSSIGPTTRTSSTSRDCPTMRRKSSSTLGYLASTCSLLLLPVCTILCRRCLSLPLQTCRPTLPSRSPVCRCRRVSLLAYRQQ